MAYRQWKRQAPGMGPFLSYHTMETRWQMQQSSVGGNLVTTTYPDDETWITPNGSYQRRTGEIRRDTEAAHAWGFHHTRFTINLMEGPPGLELARKHPEYILRNERGQFLGLYADTDPVKISVPNNRQRYPWTYVEPNLFREDVFDWAIKDLVDCVLALGEDGVYFDGRYVKKQGFDDALRRGGREGLGDPAVLLARLGSRTPLHAAARRDRRRQNNRRRPAVRLLHPARDPGSEMTASLLLIRAKPIRR